MKRTKIDRRPKAVSHDTDNSCVICFKNAKYQAVGSCDHFVCFECSTRMRVLCGQVECPICRQDNPVVVFTAHSYPFDDYAAKYATMLFEKPFGIYFESVKIKEEYLKLMYNKCAKCERYFSSAKELDEHLQREHAVSFCNLCLANVKIFTFERRFYDKNQLQKHMKSGDDDDKSHKGHPLCRFCQENFMDTDELFKHMRREHLYCHLCDSMGKIEFYQKHDDLNAHVRKSHYFCNDEKCNQQEFVLPYANEIDLKKHIATEHDYGHSRAERKQVRMLDLDFRIRPKPGHERDEHIFNPFNVVAESASSTSSYQRYEPDPVEYQLNDNNFPSLDKKAKNHTRLNSAWDTRNPVLASHDRNAKKIAKKDQFPVLGQAKVPAVSEPIRWAPEPKKEPVPTPVDKKSKENSANKKSQMTTFIVTKRPGEFPALKPLAPKLAFPNNNTALVQQSNGKSNNGTMRSVNASGSCSPLATAVATASTASAAAASNTTGAKKKKNKDWHENVYVRPQHFDDRNKKLGEKLMHLFNVSAVDEFRRKSQLYRDGFIDARTFYTTCHQLMADKFGELFVELLVLLPDIRKQNELYHWHLNEFVFNHKLIACPVCKQILKKNEFAFHQKYHEDSESAVAAARNFNSLTIS